MEKLLELVSKCKCSVSLTFNQHKDYYDGVLDYVKQEEDEIDCDVLTKMVELDSVITLQFYPETPIGFYKIHHYDVNKLIEKGIQALEEE